MHPVYHVYSRRFKRFRARHPLSICCFAVKNASPLPLVAIRTHVRAYSRKTEQKNASHLLDSFSKHLADKFDRICVTNPTPKLEFPSRVFSVDSILDVYAMCCIATEQTVLFRSVYVFERTTIDHSEVVKIARDAWDGWLRAGQQSDLLPSRFFRLQSIKFWSTEKPRMRERERREGERERGKEERIRERREGERGEERRRRVRKDAVHRVEKFLEDARW